MIVKASGPTGGAENGTYYAAYVSDNQHYRVVLILRNSYVYFEKRRILEGKKKSAKRLRLESESPAGQPLRDARRTWVYVPK